MDYKYSDFSEQDLKDLQLEINPKFNQCSIDGVFYKKLITHVDGRGDLTELWSEPWAEDEKEVRKDVKHVYYNTTHEGVVKAWHIHEYTISQYTCVNGKMQVVLVDLRDGSKTQGKVDQFIIGTKNPSFIKIPPGVLKAWTSVQGDSVIVNLLTSPDISDNYKYPWDIILKDIWQPQNG